MSLVSFFLTYPPLPTAQNPVTSPSQMAPSRPDLQLVVIAPQYLGKQILLAGSSLSFRQFVSL